MTVNFSNYAKKAGPEFYEKASKTLSKALKDSGKLETIEKTIKENPEIAKQTAKAADALKASLLYKPNNAVAQQFEKLVSKQQ